MNRRLQRFTPEEQNITVVDSMVENVVYSRPVVNFTRWLRAVATLVVLGGFGFGLWLARDKVGLLGAILVYSLEVILVVAVVCTIVLMFSLTFQFVTKPQEIRPDATGVWLRTWLGKLIPLAPIKELSTTQADKATKDKTEVREDVPTLAYLLEKKVIAPGMKNLLLGFDSAFNIVWGVWDDLKSFGIAGTARMGKTNTILFFILQAVLGFAEVWVCDIHATKQSGLIKLLQPIKRWLKMADNIPAIINTFIDFDEELQNRKKTGLTNTDGSIKPIKLMVCDEWNGILEDLKAYDDENKTEYRKFVIETAAKCCKQAAGYGMFLVLVIHTLTENEMGSVSLRNNLIGMVCHGLSTGYSKLIFVGKKDVDQAAKLKKGEVLIRNAETREVSFARISKCTYDDVVTVAVLLEELERDNNTFVTPTPQEIASSTRLALPEQTAIHSIPKTSTTSTLPVTEKLGNNQETRQEAPGSTVTSLDDIEPEIIKLVLKQVGKLIKEEKLTALEIRKKLVPEATNGRAMQYVNAAIQEIERSGFDDNE